MHSNTDATAHETGKRKTDKAAWDRLEKHVDSVLDILYSPLIHNTRRMEDYQQNKEAFNNLSDVLIFQAERRSVVGA